MLTVAEVSRRFVRSHPKPMSDSTSDIADMLRRWRGGFHAFAATIDLLGMSQLMRERPSEARARIDDLHQGFGEALLFYPGGENYRVCFAGDSLFIIREIAPEIERAIEWPAFCGHIFALACFLHTMETKLGNPGLRLALATGPLHQVREVESWSRLPWSEQTTNWFVLTGASVALKKCTDVEAGGRKAGFDGGYGWHEDPEAPGWFLGTPLGKPDPGTYRRPDLYASIYESMVVGANKRASLPAWADAS